MDSAYILIENQNKCDVQLLDKQSILMSSTLFHEEEEKKIKILASIFGIFELKRKEYQINQKDIHYKKLREVYNKIDLKTFNKAIKKNFRISLVVT